MPRERKRASVDWLALWILFSAWASLSGWILSAMGGLTPAAIILAYALLTGLVVGFRSHLKVAGGLTGWRILHSRFLAPRIWLALVVLALIGGAAYSPNNYDYMTYRFPRVLNWGWEHGWFWIPTVNSRMNYSGTGFEWLMIPSLVVFKTDRLFFLINFIAYLFLPGLIFSVFTRIGISRKISWWWMWVFPCGYCYVLQAASVANDAFAAVYFLASLHYLFQAKNSPVKSLFLSCVAIALMTGAKASNLPLLLPWTILLFFQRRLFLKKLRPAMIALILVASASVSFLPTALLNIHFTGDYSGDPGNGEKMKLSNPVIGVLGNSLQFARDNIVPPMMPSSIDWSFMLPANLNTKLHQDFPRINLQSENLQIEETSGLGFGVMLFAALFVIAGIRARAGTSRLVITRSDCALWLSGAGAFALLTYMAKMGSESTSRLIAAYYPLFIAGILTLVSLDGGIVRLRVLKGFAYVAMCSAIPLLILSPARPLFPVQLVGRIMAAIHVPETMLTRYNDVYRIYASRADAFNDLLEAVPTGERILGVLQRGNDSEAALWRPFGSRKVVEVFPQDSAGDLKMKGIRFVAVSQDALANRYHIDIAQVLAKWSGSLVAKKELGLTVHNGNETWYVIGL